MKKLLKKLSETHGPSGYEDNIRAVIRAEVKNLSREIRVDRLGNLIIRKKPSVVAGAVKKIMVTAHMDEIGIVAKHVDNNGFIRFTNIGDVYGRYALGERIRFLNGVQGIIASDKLTNGNDLPEPGSLYIDVGAANRKECRVNIGDVAVFERDFLDLEPRLVGKSLDNRTGVLVLIETLRELKSTPHDVYFVFAARQVNGNSGAGPSAFDIAPDAALIVDITHTGDTPESLNVAMNLGEGPCIKIADSLSVSDPRIIKWMIRAAEKNNIPYQREVLPMESKEINLIQTTRSGVPSGGLSIPLRYTRSTSEMIDYTDLQYSVKLLTAVLKSPLEL